jgi:hypothetical protein
MLACIGTKGMDRGRGLQRELGLSPTMQEPQAGSGLEACCATWGSVFVFMCVF